MTIQLPIDCPTAMPVIDPHDLLEDTHEQFAALREKHAVICWGERRYMVLRAADVISLTTDPRVQTMAGTTYVQLTGIPAGSLADMLTEGMLLDNGLPHRLKRGLFSRSFAHRSIAERRPAIRAVADRLVADLPRGESFDFVGTMASRLPAEMIATVLGLPTSESDFFAGLVYSVARALTPIYPIEDHYAIDNAAGELFDYVKCHLADRLRSPKDDFLTALVQQWRESDTISLDCLVQQVVQLIIGGSDTTRAAFAMLVALLLRHRDQWYAVRANKALIPGAVMEGLHRRHPPDHADAGPDRLNDNRRRLHQLRRRRSTDACRLFLAHKNKKAPAISRTGLF